MSSIAGYEEEIILLIFSAVSMIIGSVMITYAIRNHPSIHSAPDWWTEGRLWFSSPVVRRIQYGLIGLILTVLGFGLVAVRFFGGA